MKTLVTIIVLVISSCPLMAGDAWFAAGGGVGSDGLAAYSNGSIQIKKHGLVSMRFAGSWSSSKVNDDDKFFSGPSFSPGAYDIGLLVGFVKVGRQPIHSFSVSIGVGSATITDVGEYVDNWIFPDFYDKETKSATGFLVQCQFFSKNLGLQAFADFNSVRSFGGMVFSWRFLRAGKQP